MSIEIIRNINKKINMMSEVVSNNANLINKIELRIEKIETLLNNLMGDKKNGNNGMD